MDGETAVSTRAVNIAVESGAVVVVAAGNHATLPSDPARCSPPKCWYYVGSPADAFDNVTVGATTPQDEKASFSAFGPTFDGRTKPEVSAMGTNITYAKSSLNPGCDGEVCTTGNGTSFSAPMVAGIVAQMLQVDPGLTPAEVKLVLTQTARIPVSGDAATAEYPNDSLGFGIVDAAAAVAMVTAVGSHDENPLQPHYSKPYPNPARDRVYFATTGHQEPNPINIRFFDVLGREVLNRIFDQRAESTHRIEIDTSHLLTGIYVYRIVSNGSTASTGKIVVTQ